MTGMSCSVAKRTIKKMGHERLFFLLQILNAVKRINPRSFLMIVGIFAQCHHVPALTEKLHAIGMHIETVLLIPVVTVVGHVEHLVVLHRLNDGLQIFLSGWNKLQENAVFDAFALRQDITHTDGVDQP